MSLEEMARALEEMRVRVERIEARLGDVPPDTMPSGGREAPLLETVGDAIEALFGEPDDRN